MSTIAPPNLYRAYKILDPYLPSLKIGGVVGDTRHVVGGGYHISRQDLRAHGQSGDYSVQSPADQDGASNHAAAIDLTLSTTEMVTVSKRLRAAMTPNDKGEYDDRIEPLREFIGTVDNKNVCGYNRFQTGRRTGWYSSGYSESSHLWHVHLSFFRRYCNDVNSIAGVCEVVAGLAPGTLGWSADGKASTPAPAPAPAPKPTPAPKPSTPTPEGSTDYPAPTACVIYHDFVKPGTTDSDSVWWIQRWLNSVPLPVAPLLKLTGDYDADTVKAAREFQASLGDTARDGDLGPKQTLALWGKASALNPDLPKPTFVEPEDPNMPKLIATLDVPGGGIWQGAQQDQSGDWYLAEATSDGDCLIHRLAADGTYRDKMLLKVAPGEEVHPTGWAVDDGELWLTWNEADNDVVRFAYKAGATVRKADTTTVHTFSTGNMQVALSAGRDFAVLRRVRADFDEFRRYAKQALLDGVEEPIGQLVTVKRSTSRTVQGFTLTDDILTVITGRPSTKEPTLVSRYSFTTGRPLDVETIALPGEPEGIQGDLFGLKVGKVNSDKRRLQIYQLRH